MLCRVVTSRYIEFKQAKRLLANGYPQSYVALQVGVHRNTVLAWSRTLGYSAKVGQKASTQRVNSLFRRYQRLSAQERVNFRRLVRG